MTESPGLRTTLEDGTLFVEMNRPEKRNALDEALQGELLQLFTDVAADPGVRGVLHEKVLDEARESLRLIFKRAPQAYGLAKRLLHLSASVDIESGLFAESLAQSLLVGTEDHREGVRAARERRRPSFTGR
jgi:enoyl-CoA hydratase/carnithine racemase